VTEPALRFPVKTIRRAIRELLEGSIGGFRTIPQGTFKYGTFDGQALAAEQATSLQHDLGYHWFNVRIGRVRRNASTPVSSMGNYRHANVDIAIEVTTHAPSTVEEDARDDVLADVVVTMEQAVAALSYPGNLDADSTDAVTGIVSGCLLGPGEGELEYDSQPNWDQQLVRSNIAALAIVQIAQEV
jgi:hypothetical protein